METTNPICYHQHMTNSKLSTQPYKGARDFYPEDMRTENYIFDTWRKVCKLYGFEEYSFPILEPLEIFSAKTGEEIVNNQLFSFEDKGGRKLAIRPELTPGTVRMLAQKYNALPQPMKWFMIGSNWRYEKPQLGRGREFNQLEANIFGDKTEMADFEIFQLVISIMKAFGATEKMFEIKLSDRRLVSCLLTDVLKLKPEIIDKTRRMMDKRSKVSAENFALTLKDYGLDTKQIELIEIFLSGTLEELSKTIPQKLLEQNEGYQTIKRLFTLFKQNNMAQYLRFDPAVIRGFDYSDGLVYELFDKNPINKRSIFGGERFDKLIGIFGDFDLPATGFAMGDYTLYEFLKGWNLLPKLNQTDTYFVTLWPTDEDNKFLNASLEISQTLRNKGKEVFSWLTPNTKLEKQLRYADKKNYSCVIIIGQDELKNSTVTVKNLQSQKQETKSIESFIKELE